MKQLIGQAHRDWLDFDVNSDRWFGHENSFTAMERRILLTHWSGEAWNKFTTDEKYEQVRWNVFERTGCLLTVDRSGDHIIKPEGLPNYVIPTPSVLEPIDHLPSTNEQIREAEEIQIEITDIDLYEVEFFDLINNVVNNDQIDTEIIEDFVIFA